MFGLDFRFLAFILKPKTRERIEIDIEDRKRSSIFAAKQKFNKKYDRRRRGRSGIQVMAGLGSTFKIFKLTYFAVIAVFSARKLFNFFGSTSISISMLQCIHRMSQKQVPDRNQTNVQLCSSQVDKGKSDNLSENFLF